MNTRQSLISERERANKNEMNKNPCRRFFIKNRLQSSSHDVNDDGMTKNKKKHRKQQRAVRGKKKVVATKRTGSPPFSGLNKFISSIFLFQACFSVETVFFVFPLGNKKRFVLL